MKITRDNRFWDSDANIRVSVKGMLVESRVNAGVIALRQYRLANETAAFWEGVETVKTEGAFGVALNEPPPLGPYSAAVAR